MTLCLGYMAGKRSADADGYYRLLATDADAPVLSRLYAAACMAVGARLAPLAECSLSSRAGDFIVVATGDRPLPASVRLPLEETLVSGMTARWLRLQGDAEAPVWEGREESALARLSAAVEDEMKAAAEEAAAAGCRAKSRRFPPI